MGVIVRQLLKRWSIGGEMGRPLHATRENASWHAVSPGLVPVSTDPGQSHRLATQVIWSTQANAADSLPIRRRGSDQR